MLGVKVHIDITDASRGTRHILPILSWGLTKKHLTISLGYDSDLQHVIRQTYNKVKMS